MKKTIKKPQKFYSNSASRTEDARPPKGRSGRRDPFAKHDRADKARYQDSGERKPSGEGRPQRTPHGTARRPFKVRDKAIGADEVRKPRFQAEGERFRSGEARPERTEHRSEKRPFKKREHSFDRDRSEKPRFTKSGEGRPFEGKRPEWPAFAKGKPPFKRRDRDDAQKPRAVEDQPRKERVRPDAAAHDAVNRSFKKHVNDDDRDFEVTGHTPKYEKRKKPEAPRVKDTREFTRVCGLSAVSALFAKAPERVERLFYEERLKGEVGAFCAELAKTHKPYRMVPPEEMAKVSGTAVHGGIMAVATEPTIHFFDAVQAKTWAASGESLLLLDGVGNPFNFGAIIRTAAFFGIKRVVFSDHPAQASISDASYRIAEGGMEFVELYRAKKIAPMLRVLSEAYEVVAAAPGKHDALPTLKKSGKPFAIVMGNEEEGLPQATLDACDKVIAIPGMGQVQSLNVSASTAIMLYAITQG